MNDRDFQQLKLVFFDVRGRAAIEGLFSAIENKNDSVALINSENNLITAAGCVFKESSSPGALVSGKEVKAHGILRSVLLEHKAGGIPALQNLRKSLGG